MTGLTGAPARHATRRVDKRFDAVVPGRASAALVDAPSVALAAMPR